MLVGYEYLFPGDIKEGMPLRVEPAEEEPEWGEEEEEEPEGGEEGEGGEPKPPKPPKQPGDEQGLTLLCMPGQKKGSGGVI